MVTEVGAAAVVVTGGASSTPGEVSAEAGVGASTGGERQWISCAQCLIAGTCF